MIRKNKKIATEFGVFRKYAHEITHAQSDDMTSFRSQIFVFRIESVRQRVYLLKFQITPPFCDPLFSVNEIVLITDGI